LKNDITLQESEILHESARETNTGEQDESEKHDSFITEHPTILQNQTTKDTKDQFGQKRQHKEFKIKNKTTVNSYAFTFINIFHFQLSSKLLIGRYT
jgi:hypothetical protein